MSDLLPQRSALISQFEEHLARARYSSTASKRYLAVAGHFLKYIEGRPHAPKGKQWEQALEFSVEAEEIARLKDKLKESQ